MCQAREAGSPAPCPPREALSPGRSSGVSPEQEKADSGIESGGEPYTSRDGVAGQVSPPVGVPSLEVGRTGGFLRAHGLHLIGVTMEPQATKHRTDRTGHVTSARSPGRRGAIEYAPLTAERLDDAKALLLPFWKRSWEPGLADRIFRWRFLERSDWEATLAYDGDRPVGFVDCFFSPYRTGAGVVRVRESADWFCHPDYRPLVGIRLLRSIMAKPEPILIVGGRGTAHQIVSRMGWSVLPDLGSYVLPTGTGALVKGLSKRLRFPLSSVPGIVARGLSIRTALAPGAGRGPVGGTVTLVEDGTALPRIEPAPGAYGLSALITPEKFEWLRKAPPEVGRFFCLAFDTGDGERGLALGRIYQDGPFRAGRILHLTATAPTLGTYAWMIGEAAQLLVGEGAQWITARFSSRTARDALEAVGFRYTGSCSAFWWHPEAPPVEGPVDLGWATGDEGVLPYPN
jgi:hypothetical protein